MELIFRLPWDWLITGTSQKITHYFWAKQFYLVYFVFQTEKVLFP